MSFAKSASDFIMASNVKRFLISLIKTVLKLFVTSSKIPMMYLTVLIKKIKKLYCISIEYSWKDSTLRNVKSFARKINFFFFNITLPCGKMSQDIWFTISPFFWYGMLLLFSLSLSFISLFLCIFFSSWQRKSRRRYSPSATPVLRSSHLVRVNKTLIFYENNFFGLFFFLLTYFCMVNGFSVEWFPYSIIR